MLLHISRLWEISLSNCYIIEHANITKRLKSQNSIGCTPSMSDVQNYVSHLTLYITDVWSLSAFGHN
jgi:hypothetical protein